jgi:hypothetical protein
VAADGDDASEAGVAQVFRSRRTPVIFRWSARMIERQRDGATRA